MPTKTRKEKLLAQQHRKHVPFVPDSTSPSGTQAQLPTFSFTREKSSGAILAEGLTLVRRDVVKTLLLGLLAISVEFGMYWYGFGKM